MLTAMSAQDAMKLAESVDTTDPALGLRAVASLRTLVERLEALHVAQARDQGWSWQDIGAALGVSKEAVPRKDGGGALRGGGGGSGSNGSARRRAPSPLPPIGRPALCATAGSAPSTSCSGCSTNP